MTESYKHKIKYLDDPKIILEMIDCLCGELIGRGCFRDVYEYSLDKRYVVKIENEEGSGDNFTEWRVWQCVEQTEHRKWFAECTWISDNGLVLVQRKTKDFYSKKEERVPDKIPSFFTDVKPDNFGWIGSRLVCHDYSYCLERFSYYALTKRMRSVKGELK